MKPPFISACAASSAKTKGGKGRLTGGGLFLCFAALLGGAMSQTACFGERPNIIVILADDLGLGDIGAYRALHKSGEDKSLAWRFTPNLDRLAEQGIRFTRAYTCSWCAPSRQMLLSGQWANRTSAYSHPWIGAQLRRLGYVTGMVGKSHGARPTQKVFGNVDPGTAEFDDGLFFNGGQRNHYMKPGESLPGRQGLRPFSFQAKGGEQLTDVFTEHAVEFIRRSAGAKKPFMLYLPYTAPHTPLQGKPDDLRRLFPDLFSGLSDAGIRATAEKKDQRLRKAHYAALVHGVDRGVGAVMQALRGAGVEDNTFMLFTSDNGAIEGSNHPLTGHKTDLLDGGIRVPFILWSAAMARSGLSGAVYDGLVSLADIAPTVMALAINQTYAFPTDGIDLMPCLLGQKPPSGRRYFWANSSRGATGMDSFDSSPPGGQIRQAVLVGDDEKILCWHRQGSTSLGTVHSRLPNAAGQDDPAALLRERTPISGKLAESPGGKALFQELCRMVNAPESGLEPDWSGEASSKATPWWLSASGTAVTHPASNPMPPKRKKSLSSKMSSRIDP